MLIYYISLDATGFCAVTIPCWWRHSNAM